MSATPIKLSSEELSALDLIKLNEGVNPYNVNDASVERAFRLGAEWYRRKVNRNTGFKGGARVLDLLGGFGRWTIFLGEQNDEVIALDQVPGCATLGEKLAKETGQHNLEFLTGDVVYTKKFADNSFDYIWMWSALQYVSRRDTLLEVYRLLKPGGKLYVGNYNSTGLMLKHFYDGVEAGAINEGSSQWALNALASGPQDDRNGSFAEPAHCDEICQRHGLELVKAARDGELDLSRETGLKDSFKGELLAGKYSMTIEFVARRGDAVPTVESSEEVAEASVAETAEFDG